MIDRMQYVPAYIQIKNALQEQILSLQPGERIQSEHELARIYGVSRGTVKEAIMELVREEALYRVQGKGTFVSNRKFQRSLERLPTFSKDIRRLGVSPRSQEIFLGPVTDKPRANEALGLPQGQPVMRYTRLLKAEDVPVALITSYLAMAVYPGLTSEKIGNSLYDCLYANYDLPPVRASDTFHAVVAPKNVAQVLLLPEGAPLFYSTRHAYVKTGECVEYVESYIRGDQYMIEINIDALRGGDVPQYSAKP